MAATKRQPTKKYYTPAEANATLPLVRAIVTDITALARDLRERQERLTQIRPPKGGRLGRDYEEELHHLEQELEADRERMLGYVEELTKLGVELKDPDVGLIDFLGRMNGRDVYLCWRLGEPEVGYWHDLDAGFAGRQKLRAEAKR
jgi:hypothetical protein